jgi:hypothetical protein
VPKYHEHSISDYVIPDSHFRKILRKTREKSLALFFTIKHQVMTKSLTVPVSYMSLVQLSLCLNNMEDKNKLSETYLLVCIWTMIFTDVSNTVCYFALLCHY